jgi:hypothetical protein
MNSIDKITKPLLDSFERLPPDPYLKGDFTFRYRAFSEALVKVDLVQWAETSEFFQSTNINNYAGGLTRRFAPLSPEACEFSEKFAVEPQLRHIIQADEFLIGVHQMRVIANDFHTGYPAPEGFHHDGFDYVAISAIAHHNLNGGVSILADSTDVGSIIFDRVITPGETLVLDDRAIKHYVSPITPKVPGEAHRDVIVATIKIYG